MLATFRRARNSTAVLMTGLLLPSMVFAQSAVDSENPNSRSNTGSAPAANQRNTESNNTTVTPAQDDGHIPHMPENALITDVTDALDTQTTFAPRLSVGFVRTQRGGTLQRERSPISRGTNPGDPTLSPSGTTELDDVARYTQSTYTLNLGAEIPVFHDLSFSFIAPLILSDQRGFEATDTNSSQLLRDGYTVDGTPGTLFGLPFKSPDRAGVDQFRIGFNWNILNQARDQHMPTWLIRLEWRPPVGDPLVACEGTPTGARCPQLDAPRPSDPTDSVNIMTGMGPAYERPNGTRTPGISRGVHGAFFQTVLSRRYGFFEPFLGLEAMIEVPGARLSQFRYGADRPFGQLSSIPPIQGALTVGMEVVPWENREQWQRFAIDLRMRGEYHSQGRDYTPLFDALGSSNSIPLTSPSWSVRDGQAANPANAIWFTGTTTTQSYARLGMYFGLNMQAARQLRFTVSGSVLYTTPHAFTATDACNPNESSNNPADRGGCAGSSVPDPMHRTVIDSAGARFRMANDITWDISANLTFTPRVPW